MTFVLYAFGFIALAYSLFIFSCYVGFRITKRFTSDHILENTYVSIVVPVRNEERNLKTTLSQLIQQNYPAHLFEIIIIDDHSTDKSPEIVASFIHEHQSAFNLRYLQLDADASSKKNAITKGITIANGSLIITTDADCTRNAQWLPSIVSFFEEFKPEMICSPVAYSNEENLFQKIQSLEFCGLIGITAGSIRFGKPMFCNGANLAFTKSVFEKVNGYASEDSYASGDDTALMKKIAAISPSSIHFLKSIDAMVYTQGATSFLQFIHQRIRWASKIPSHMSPFTIAVATIAWLVHLGLLVSLFIFLFNPSVSPLVLLPFVIKIFSECILLNAVAGSMRKQRLVWLLLPAEIIYPFYIVLVGALSPFLNFKWKGRTIESGKIPTLR
jgi:cellulose synthase/poly-beta-1,6-N-acetylglucosamine synthase-like glycosyltransferase